MADGSHIGKYVNVHNCEMDCPFEQILYVNAES